jgi:predicted small secreted protein
MNRLRMIVILVGALGLGGCNTMIGMGRDVKEGYQWTADKIRGNGDSSATDYGAPIY